jgi:hypothetical protein
VTPTPSATASASPSATATPSCAGDCENDGQVTVDDLVKLINIALGIRDLEDCLPGDTNNDSLITVEEIIQATNNALNGCPV